MPHESEPALVVLNGVRLKGFAASDAVADAFGLPVRTVDAVLTDFRDRGLAVLREGRVSGWALTPAGRAEHTRLVAAERQAAGCAAELEAAYREFLGLNPKLLTLASAWQLRGEGERAVPNDHSDPAYDSRVIGKLRALHGDAVPLAGRLHRLLARFGRYGPRLSRALERLEAGEHDWFTKPLIDSYHTVWFELHEDLLATLGKERASEETKEPA